MDRSIEDTASIGYSEPDSGWGWVTGEPLVDQLGHGCARRAHSGGSQNGATSGGDLSDDYIGTWNDNVFLDADRSDSYIIEWSADCNGDGIVDYGQILDGTLIDADENGVPDCCEDGSCTPTNAIQWRVEDGGNGHWYESVPVSIGSFEELIAIAEARGADPVSVTSQGEHDIVASLVTPTTPETWTYLGARISGVGGCGPDSWVWLDGSAWSYTNWDQSNPTNQPDCAGSDAIVIGRPNGDELLWHDGPITNTSINVFAIIEWSADCNGDGIVDYG